MQKKFFDALKYVKEAFHTELSKKEDHCKFILAPYNERYVIFSYMYKFSIYVIFNSYL